MTPSAIAVASAGTVATIDPTAAALLAATATTVLCGLVVPPARRRPVPSATVDEHRDVDLTGWVGALGRSVRALVARPRRRRPVQPDDAAAWCDELARRVRAGSTLRDALTHATPAGPDLRDAVAPTRLALERGASVADAVTIAEADRRVHAGHRHVALVLSVARACAVTGSPPAEPLDRTAGALRRRAADRDERSAQAAQARMSAHVMTIVPLVALGLLAVADPQVRRTAVSPVGVACLVAGGGLNALGWWWMRRVTRPAP